jgi:effector-binding domain-containing protein
MVTFAASQEGPAVLILKKIVIIVVVLVVALAAIGMLLPRNVHVERAITIDAPASTVYALLDGYRQFNKWSPWAALDPNAQYTYSGPASGIGAKMSWVGNKEVGSGSQEIVDVKRNELIKTKLDFGEQGIANASFTLTPEGTGTKVTWGLDSDMGKGPIGRYFGLFMDKMIGKDYEKGLASLKKLAEGLPKTDFGDLAVFTGSVEPVWVAYVSAESSKDTNEIAKAIGAAYQKVLAFMNKNNLKQIGPPITINTRWDDTGYGFDAALPIEHAPDKPVPADSPVQVKQTYAGPVLKAVVKGPYTGMPVVYEKLNAYMAAKGYESAGPPWDAYVSDPVNTPAAELTTNIYQPVK